MRILLTQQGDEVLKTFAEEEKDRSLKEAEDAILKKRSEFRLSLNKEDDNIKKIIAKEIQIKQKLIPKNITDRYNDDMRQSLVIIPQFNLAASLEQNNILTLKNSIKLKSVLQNKSISDLKKYLTNEKNMKDRHSRIDDTNFRTIYEDKNIADKLEQKLNYEINLDNINLIKYLNRKEIISDKLIEKINTYNHDKVNKIDKICQMINQQEVTRKNISDYIKGHLTEIRSKNSLEFKKKINVLETDINYYSNIVNKYPITIKNKDKFRDIHGVMQNKYWRKYNADKLQRTSWKLNQNSQSSSELNYQSKNISNE